ncbi:hypothetical protein ATY41_03295 [Leifsonia xyli subsp. xyli]|uniref:Uncharacterized protein n=1 Tax=Leifsonia xyli subsp. xyli TaxID=59736 RepID=A0A1E2SJN2_LEIXY|nr:hypothetical protein [Leifsonia xyli]ODA90062.1 hypothetical protein ATY41_03295 [Leifsonia xyli subsp. xyli]
MTLTGASTVEELIPGNPAAIENVVQNIGSGVGPARQIAGAWKMMTLPGWEGRGGNAWRAFTPKKPATRACCRPRSTVSPLRSMCAMRTALHSRPPPGHPVLVS